MRRATSSGRPWPGRTRRSRACSPPGTWPTTTTGRRLRQPVPAAWRPWTPSGTWRITDTPDLFGDSAEAAMLSREEYERIIRTFLVELNHLCAESSEPELRAMPRFEKEIDSYLADLQEPITDAAYSLRDRKS